MSDFCLSKATRLFLIQEELPNKLQTEGNAKQYDYDRFIVEWGPDRATTFQFEAFDGNANEVD